MRETINDWHKEANCLGSDPEIFFPERGEDMSIPRAVCNACNVKVECLQEGIDEHEEQGIRAGLSARERRYILTLIHRGELERGKAGFQYLQGKEDGTIQYRQKRGRPSNE